MYFSQSLSSRMNLEGLQKLRRYCAIRTRRPPQGQSQWSAIMMQEVAELLHTAQEHLDMSPHSKMKESSTWILAVNRAARLVGAGRVTTCKDGMDLTSMATTLEFATLLRDNHKVPGVEDVATTFRLRGVRLDNILKNTFQRQFTTLVRENLSKKYQPPRGSN